MSRRSRGGIGGGYDIYQEGVQEERKAGLMLDFWVPLLQAASVGFAVLLSAVSACLVLLSYGEGILWVCFSVGAIGTFCWHALRASRDLNRKREGLIAASQTFFLGVFFYSVWRVSAMVGIELPSWSITLLRVASPLLLVLFSVIAILLSLRFVQESVLASPYIEQSVGEILRELVVFWGKKPKPKDGIRHIYGVDPARAGNGEGTGSDVEEDREGGLLASLVDEAEMSRYDILEWLVLGSVLPIKYSRRKWKGIALSSGTVVTETMARQWANELSEAGILVGSGSGKALTDRITIEEALAHISVGEGLPPPSTELVDNWLVRAGYSPHPIETGSDALEEPLPPHPIPSHPIPGGEE